jgi:hypothetical protein
MMQLAPPANYVDAAADLIIARRPKPFSRLLSVSADDPSAVTPTQPLAEDRSTRFSYTPFIHAWDPRLYYVGSTSA